jgi:hypothetical protein
MANPKQELIIQEQPWSFPVDNHRKWLPTFRSALWEDTGPSVSDLLEGEWIGELGARKANREPNVPELLLDQWVCVLI